MKILLVAINAKYIHSNLAVYDLRAYAKAYQKSDAQIEIAEYTINHQIDDILEGIYRAKPDVLCFSCYICNLSYVEELSGEYHKLCPKIPIWAGGPEVSYETRSFRFFLRGGCGRSNLLTARSTVTMLTRWKSGRFKGERQRSYQFSFRDIGGSPDRGGACAACRNEKGAGAA